MKISEKPFNRGGTILFASLFLIALFAVSCQQPAGETGIVKTGTNPGNIAADFTLTDQNGSVVSLHDYEGKVILLDISTMWCPPCRTEAEDSEEFYQSRKDDGLIILSVLSSNLQRQPPKRADARAWAGRYGITFPVLADTDQRVSAKYNNTGYVPLNLIIDRNMRIRYKKPGYNRAEIERKVDELLAVGTDR